MDKIKRSKEFFFKEEQEWEQVGPSDARRLFRVKGKLDLWKTFERKNKIK